MEPNKHHKSVRHHASSSKMANENATIGVPRAPLHAKSAANLKTIPSNGALRNGPRRGALADLSNVTASAVLDNAANNTYKKDSKNAGILKSASVHRVQSNNSARPLSNHPVKPHHVSESRSTTVLTNTRNGGPKRPVIYKDGDSSEQRAEPRKVPLVSSSRISPRSNGHVAPVEKVEQTLAGYDDRYHSEVITALVSPSLTEVAGGTVLDGCTTVAVAGNHSQSLNCASPLISTHEHEETYSDGYSEIGEESYDEGSECSIPSYQSQPDYDDYLSYTQDGQYMGPIPAPKVTESIRRQLDAARLQVEASETIEDIEEELGDIGMVREYADDIFDYMLEREKAMRPDPCYMARQTELRWSMRSVLIDWVVQVHARFRLYPETLHLTVNLIDRFLSKKIVSLGKLQLVGATALLIASKYEEVNVPSVGEMVFMVDEGYQADEIIKAEKYMATLLEWQLGYPSPLNFLRRTSKADTYDEQIRTVAKYLIEVALMDERFVSCGSSLIAAGAHCLARCLLGAGDWTPAHAYYSGYTYEQLQLVMVTLVTCLERAKKHHPAVFEKYKDVQFEPSQTVQRKLRNFTLPLIHVPRHT